MMTIRMSRFTLLHASAVILICGVSCDRQGGGRIGGVDEPLSINASTVGRFANGYSWQLNVNPAREAELTIHAFPKQIRRSFKVAKGRIEELKGVLRRERFFELKGEYGEHVPDGSCDTLAIVWGKQTHTVKIRFLMSWVHSDPSRLQEPARAVRVFNAIRDWFDDPEAVDLRRYDRMVLDAAQKHAQQQGRGDGLPTRPLP
jgi:hypothetical protein